MAPEDGTRADTRRLFAFALSALETLAVEFPDPRLRKVAEPVAEVTDDHRTLIEDMFETMYDAINHEAVANSIPAAHPNTPNTTFQHIDTMHPMGVAIFNNSSKLLNNMLIVK